MAMFSGLKRKITTYMVLTIFLFVLTIGSIAFLLVSRNYVRTYAESAIKTVKLAISYSEIKLDNIITDGEKIVSDSVVIDGLEGTDYVITINPKLNFLRSLYQEEIIGLAIYGLNGRLYKTDSLSTGSIIPYDTLMQNPDVSAFIHSTVPYRLFLLSQEQSVQSFSLIFRINDVSDTDLGYLLININPAYLFTEYFAFADNENLILEHNLVKIDDTIYYPSLADSAIGLALEDIGAGFHSGYRVYVIKEKLYNDNVTLITTIDSSLLRSSIDRLAWQMGLIIIAFSAVSFGLSKLMSGIVSTRLEQLAAKMRKATETMQR